MTDDQFRMDPLIDAAVGFTRANVMAKVQFAVAAKVLDMQKFEGAAAVKLITAASAGMNKAGDALVAAATGVGGELDVYG